MSATDPIGASPTSETASAKRRLDGTAELQRCTDEHAKFCSDCTTARLYNSTHCQDCPEGRPSAATTTAARSLLFVDGPERPPITVEGHDGHGHAVIAWDWSGGGWVRYDIPCSGRLSECPQGGVLSGDDHWSDCDPYA